MLELLGGLAAVVTIAAGCVALFRWSQRRRQVELDASAPVVAPVADKWVDLEYVEDAGVTDRLRREGYRAYWSGADKEARRVGVEGWEVVVDELEDGRRVRYKVRDPSVGGYLVLLKKKQD